MPVDDRELLLEHLEALAGGRERDPVRGVLGVVPTRAEPELDPPAAHRVGLRDLDRERTREAERHRRHERAEPDARRLAAERGERHPRVGRARAGSALADALVVVGPEERVEAELLGRLGDREQLVVRRALLRFGEDSQLHRRGT